jgi:hypothetical protein
LAGQGNCTRMPSCWYVLCATDGATSAHSGQANLPRLGQVASDPSFDVPAFSANETASTQSQRYVGCLQRRTTPTPQPPLLRNLTHKPRTTLLLQRRVSSCSKHAPQKQVTALCPLCSNHADDYNSDRSREPHAWVKSRLLFAGIIDPYHSAGSTHVR